MIRKTTAFVLVLMLIGSFAVPAFGAQAEPSLIGQAWYWETQQNQNVDTPIGSVSGELPNPFCPGLPSGLGAPGDTCAEGRLPVEILQGDYETPDKVSALAFDMTMLTVGSKVKSFTVSLLEAETGCRENPDTETDQSCEETDARNIEGKVVQACEVTEIFGDGEARQYKEIPKFSCTDQDAVGERKEVKNDAEADPTDTDPDHVWTWDLTALARRWAETPPLCTCILLHPQKPKNPEDDATEWRVVFTGPKIEKGVETNLVFTPGEGGALPTLPTAPTTSGVPTSTGSTGSLGGSTTTVGGGLDSSTTDLGGGDAGAAPAGDEAEAPEDPLAAGDDSPAADIAEVEPMPGYVWLAILAGLIGFSLARSVILEKASGRRANGVLAQIHQINAARGSTVAASGAAGGGAFTALWGGLGAVKNALSPIGNRLSSVAGKIKGKGKG